MIVYSPSQRSMASQSRAARSGARPPPPRASSHHSPTDDGDRDRVEPPKRAHTFQTTSTIITREPDRADAFEADEHSDSEVGIEVTRASVELDMLPIELITLTDRYSMS